MLGGKSPGLAVRAFEGGGRGALAGATGSAGTGATSATGVCCFKLERTSEGCPGFGAASEFFSEPGEAMFSSGAGNTEDATALMPALEAGLKLVGALALLGVSCFAFSGVGLAGVVCETPELNIRVCKGPSFWDSG